MNKVLTLSILTLLFSCISPDEISVSADSEAKAIDELLKSVVGEQSGGVIHKQVQLNHEKQTVELAYDTVVVQNDLKVLTEISFGHLLREASYNKVATDQGVLFERKAKEKKGPVSVLVLKNEKKEITGLDVIMEYENYLYHSNQKIVLEFESQKLAKYIIRGNRKLIGLDPSSYIIEVIITP